MSASAKRPRTEDPSTVNISAKSQDGNQMFFMIKRHVPMKRLLSNYCEKKLGLENGDQIHADGGGGCCSNNK
ncbi:hypothetical protein ACOSQ4_006578 [Xanthoceras sorbifolium]